VALIGYRGGGRGTEPAAVNGREWASGRLGGWGAQRRGAMVCKLVVGGEGRRRGDAMESWGLFLPYPSAAVCVRRCEQHSKWSEDAWMSVHFYMVSFLVLFCICSMVQ
jgi:hypothetical protein